MSKLTETMYLDVDETPTFAVLHRSASDVSRDTAVVICPPFGWEEMCSYRSLREWANRLAADGYPTLRLTFPGCGDSAGSPRDPDRLDTWTKAVAVAARTLRDASGARAVVAFGLGLGGLIAYRCAAMEGELIGLALWATPSKAKDLIRQLRAFSRLEAPLFFEGLAPPPALEDGDMEVGGFLLTGQTVAELNALDLTTLSLKDRLPRGALLIERDGMAADKRLREALEGAGVTTNIAAGEGYAGMTSHPQLSEVPEAVVGRLQAWLNEQASSVEPITQEPWRASLSAQIETGDGSRFRETPVEIVHGSVSLSGVLAMPEGSHSMCVVFLPSGAMRRIGPNRTWVESARSWAARGVPSLRLDLEGIGDGGGPEAPYHHDAALYDSRLLGQVKAAVEALHGQGVAEEFTLVGLCSGAYWSLHALLEHPRVRACILLNLRAIVYDPDLSPSRDLGRLFSEPLSWTTLRRNVTSERLSAVLRLLLTRARRRLSRLRADGALPLAVRADAVLDDLQASGKLAALLFTDHEALDEELVRSGRMAQMEQWPNVLVQRIAVRDHTYRPLWAQRQVIAALDVALTRVLEPESTAVA